MLSISHQPHFEALREMTEERILDFLDGKLDSEAEEELLHTLAVSPERRLLLKEHMRIRELLGTLAKEDRFAVPPIVTNELYAKLAQLGLSSGAAVAPVASTVSRIAQYAAPIAGSAVTAAAILETSTPGIGFRFSSVVVTGVISFLLGIGVFYFLSNGIAEEPKYAFRSHIEAPATAIAETPRPSSTHYARIALPKSEIVTERVLATNEASLSNLGTAPLARLVMPVASTQSAVAEPALRTIDGVMESVPVANHIGDPGAIAQPIAAYIGSGKTEDEGTVSFRVGGGLVPGSGSKNVASLSEMKFSWKLLNWVVGRASVGYFVPFQQEANPARQIADGTWQISTSTKPQTLPVIGAELGLTFDEINVPAEISGGFMADGAGKIYWRYGAFGHFSLFDKLNVSIGAEGMLYTHDISQSLQWSSALYSIYHPKTAPGTPTKEISGFIGPAIELGWRF